MTRRSTYRAATATKEDGATLAERLQSREPTPSEVVERKEHVAEVAPHIFHEVGRIFGRNTRKVFCDEATVGELLAFEGGVVEIQVDPFRDVIEEIFFGLTFEQVRAYAKRAA